MPPKRANPPFRRLWMRVVLPAPEGAERMKSSPRCIHAPGGTREIRAVDGSTKKLLHVLHLFPDLLTQHLGIEHGAGHFGIAALGAEGVELAEDLLGQEVEALAGRAGLAGHGAEVFEVRAQAVDLFADVAAVDEERRLLGHAALVDGLPAKELSQAAAERGGELVA